MSSIGVTTRNKRSKLIRLCTIALALVGFFSLDSDCLAIEAGLHETPKGLGYRRIFVPADTPEKWPVGSKRYVPISNSEFSRLIEQSTSHHLRNHVTDVRLTKATYAATYSSGNLLEGQTELAVYLSGKTPRLLSLTPLNLVITSAYWQRAPNVPVNLALWNRGLGNSPELGVSVEQSGTLQLDWQLQAVETSGNDLRFDLKIPVSAPQTFALTLPSNRIVSITTGELVSTEELSPESKRWTFQLGSNPVHRLSISQTKTPLAEQQLPRFSQTAAYSIDPQGLSLLSHFRLDSYDKPSAEELSFLLSDGINVVSVMIDQEEMEWQIDTTEIGTVLTTKVAAASTQKVIEIRSLSQILFDKPWQLPSLRLLNATWTEGTSSLKVSPALELLSLVPQRATLEHIVGLGDVATEESYRLQEWTEDATFEVIVGKRSARISSRTATIVDLDPADIDDTDVLNLFEINSNDTTAKTISVLTCQDRPVYQFEGEISPDWSIEAIKTNPSNALREWHVYQQEDRKLLRIQLDRPLEPGNQLQIECDSRATTEDLLLPATANELIPVRIFSDKQTKQLLLLRSQKRGQLELLYGLDSARIQFATLSVGDAALLPGSADGVLIDLTRLSNTTPIRLSPRPAQYRADVNVEVSVLPDALVHLYQLDCTPTSGVVSELVLGFDEPLPKSTQWKIAGQPSEIIAQRLDQATNKPSAHGQGIRYLIRLPVAFDKPFQLQASYSKPASNTQKCNLIHPSDDVNWQGRLIIRGPLNGIELDDRGWVPIAGATNESSAHAELPAIGSYRLGPDRAGIRTIASTLTITRNKKSPNTPNLVAWLASIQSSLSEDGTVIYVATYHLENSGAAGAELELPQQAKLQDAWINQQQLDPKEVLADASTCRFHFSDQRRFSTITIQYVMQGDPLGHSSKLEPKLPSCSYPIEYGRWALWTPEHFKVESLSGNQLAGHVDWSTRLFGPLRRPPSVRIFNPLRADAWQQIWSASDGQRVTRRSAERITQLLAEIIERGEEQRWGNVLNVLGNDFAIDKKLLIDRSAFDSLGIQVESHLTPITPVTNEGSKFSSSSNTSKTLNPLERYGLALVTTPNLTIFTSQKRTSQWRDQLSPTITPNVFRVSSKSLALRLERSVAGETSTGGMATDDLDLIDVITWTAFPKLAKSPWDAPVASLMSDIGRRATTLEFADTPPMVLIQREYGQRAEWYAIWFLTLVLTCRQLARSPRYFFLAIATSAAVCLVAPLSWLAIPQAIFLGLLSSIVLLVFLPNKSPSTSQLLPRSLSLRTASIALLIGGSLITRFGFAAPANNEEPAESNNNLGEIHRVLIPVDKDGNTQGDDIYLPENFYTRLQHSQGDTKHDGAQCVLRSIQYRGLLPSEPQAAGSDDKNWTISLKIESFVSGGKLFLPFHRDEAVWNAAAHRLNGFPVAVDWESDGIGCTIDLDAAGNYELELSVRPNVSLTEDGAKILLHTPAVPGAKLTLMSETGFRELSIPTAGEIAIDKAKNSLQAILSASDTLVINWSAAHTLNVDLQSYGDVDLLSWLHVDPTAARLDVQLHLRLKNTESRQFLLVTSPDLKLLPVGDNTPVETAAYLSDRRNTLEITLKPDVNNEVVVPLQFKLRRTVSVGRIDYPTLQILGFTLNRSLLAVSVRAGLSYDESLRSEALSVRVADFITEWKANQEPPLYAYALGRGGLEGSLRIWPDPKSLVAQQSMKVHCQLAKTNVTYEASVSEVGGSWLTYRMRVPPQLQIDEITIQQLPKLTGIPVRWHRVNDTQVAVLMGQAMQEPHLLTLRGHIPTPDDGILAIPSISLVEAHRVNMRMDLSRDPEVLVNWLDPEHIPEAIPQQSISRGSSANLVGRYVWQDRNTNTLSKLKVIRNHRQFDADMVTTIAQGPDGWTGTAHALVKVQDGMLGQLTFAVPDIFQKPYQIEPPALGSVREKIDGYGRRLAVVQLQKPLSKGQELALHLSGGINLTVDQRLMVPDIRLPDASRGNRYVLLPSQLDGKSISWDWPGLTPESLPEDLGVLLKSQENTRAFRVEQEQFSARQRSYQGTLKNAVWRYSLVTGMLDQNGNFSATAELVMQPGRATHCTIQLPENAKLIQLLTGDNRVRREKTKEGNWRIPLGPPNLPRRITVSYQTQLKVSAERYEFQSPILLIDNRPLPPPQTRWKIRPQGQLRLSEPVIGRVLSPEQFSGAALKLSLQTLADARLLALELPKQEGLDWFQPWQRRTQQAWEDWRILDPTLETLDELSATDFGSLKDEPENGSRTWSTLVEHLGDPHSNPLPKNLTAAYPPALPGQINNSETRSEKYYLSDTQEHLVLEPQSTLRGKGWSWFFAVLIVGASLSLSRQISRSADWAMYLRKQPYRLLIVIGLLGWVLFTPSAAGLLLASCTMLSLAFRRAKRVWWRQFRNTRSQIAASAN